MRLIAAFAFDDIAAVAEEATVKAQAIGDARFGGAGVTEGPVACVKFVHPAPRVAADIGRVIPCAVEHDAPAHELGAGVM